MSLSTLIDFLFPAFCVSCKKAGFSLCNACARTIPFSEPACFVCNTRNSPGSICRTCRRHMPHLTRIWWASEYDNEPLRTALREFKYANDRALAAPLASFIVASVKKRVQAHKAQIPPGTALLAIPLHSQKKRERGFNQSELLATCVSQELSLMLLPPHTLERTVSTLPQAHVRTREGRRKNVLKAFTVPPAKIPAIAEKTILLVDDIATTGSTLDDAARALKEAGAAHVWGLVVAKG